MFHELLVLSAAVLLICIYAIVLGWMFALHLHESLAVEPIANEREHEFDDFG
jgi:hypothetical protein